MIGSLLSRALVLVFGYAYPAYECYKTVELNKPDIELLRFWCQYWTIVAVFGILEWFADIFIFWLPFYSEAKVAFYIYLWYPKTRGTIFIYETYFKPYMVKHEPEIDRNLQELRTRAGDILMLYLHQAVSYGQTRFLEVLQFVASQAPRTRPAQQQQQPPPPQPQPEQRQFVKKYAEALERDNQESSAEVPPVARRPSFVSREVIPVESNASDVNLTSSGSNGRPHLVVENTELVDATDSLSTEESNSAKEETLIEEAIRMTQSSLRKRAGNPVDVGIAQ